MDMALQIRALHTQHLRKVEEILASHLLWMPEIFLPLYSPAGTMRTTIRLNDGRECSVETCSLRRETSVSGWEMVA